MWSISKVDDCVYRLEMEFVSDPKTILLTSDIHWDSAHCRLDILKKKFQEAVDNNSPIVICGDFFDAMQGKWDPRSSTSALRPEHRTGKYLDSLVETSAEWLKPFAKNIAMISYGNHETSIRKRHEVDLIQRLCQELKRQESPVICGQYTGFIHVVGKVKDLPSQQDSFSIHYHHGAGGGGEITRGFIDHSRTRGMYRADVFISGHIHRRNYDENIITTITSKGKLRNRKQLFLRSSCWKDEMKDEWHKIQGRGARPIGGWWLNLEMIRKKKNYELLYTAFPT